MTRQPGPYSEVEPFGPEFRALFAAARDIFRLEALQSYAVGYEDEALRRFRAGQPAGEDDEEMRWYLGVLHRIRSEGGTMQRVHVVTEPLSEYLRFEFATYDRTVAAGEDVRIVPVAPGETWPAGVSRWDFWLFDSRVVAFMDYDTAGQLFACRVVEKDPALIDQCNRWRDVAVDQSVPYLEYRRSGRGDDAIARAVARAVEAVGRAIAALDTSPDPRRALRYSDALVRLCAEVDEARVRLGGRIRLAQIMEADPGYFAEGRDEE